LVTLKKKIIYVLSAALFGYAYFQLTAFLFFNVAQGDILLAVMWILGTIIAFVLWEKVEYKILARMKAKDEDRKVSLPRRALKRYMSGASVKSALYLFYMAIIIGTAIHAAAPDMSPLLRDLSQSGYFQAVQPGILFLVASDKFFDQIFKDIVKDESGGTP